MVLAARCEFFGNCSAQVQPRPPRLCPGTAGPGSKNPAETHPGGTLLEKIRIILLLKYTETFPFGLGVRFFFEPTLFTSAAALL